MISRSQQQQRKQPTRRAFTGLAGSPWQSPAATVKSEREQLIATVTRQWWEKRATRCGSTVFAYDGRIADIKRAQQRDFEELRQQLPTLSIDELRKLAGVVVDEHPKETPAERKRRERSERADARAIAKAMAVIGPPTTPEERAEDKRGEKLVEASGKRIEKREKKERDAAARLPHRSDGMAIKGAPAGKGELVTGGGKIETISDAHDTADGGTRGGRRVKPQGTGHVVGHKSDAVTYENGACINKGDDDNTPILKGKGTFAGTIKFQNDRTKEQDEKHRVLEELIGTFNEGKLESSVFEAVPDTEIFRCRCCNYETWSWNKAQAHFKEAVEEEIAKHKATANKQKGVAEAIDDLYIPATVSFKVEKEPLGDHAQIFMDVRKQYRQRVKAFNAAVERAKSEMHSRVTKVVDTPDGPRVEKVYMLCRFQFPNGKLCGLPNCNLHPKVPVRPARHSGPSCAKRIDYDELIDSKVA